MEPTLRSVQFLKQEAEGLVYNGKDIAEYAKQQQTYREEKAAWRDIQKQPMNRVR